MPKIPTKIKNKRVNLLINASENSSRLNRKTGIYEDNSNSLFTDIKPKFPPTLTTNDLIKNTNKSNTFNRKSFPNAFIAYRMALTKEYHNKSITLPHMGHLSKIAKKSWEKESQNVKDFYHKLSGDARFLYKKTTFKSNLQDNSSYVLNSDVMNSNFSDREAYIRDLELIGKWECEKINNGEGKREKINKLMHDLERLNKNSVIGMAEKIIRTAAQFGDIPTPVHKLVRVASNVNNEYVKVRADSTFRTNAGWYFRFNYDTFSSNVNMVWYIVT
ncbi:11686_t:CDS:2, partial [Funneliformis mosseae]